MPAVQARLPTSRFMAAVLVGDLVVLFAFVATGQYAHEYYFWEFPMHTVMVLLPFLIAWLVVAPLAGLFSRNRIHRYELTVVLVVIAWVAASLLGGLIRSTAYFPGGMPPSFLAATIAFGILFLVPWRLFVSWLLNTKATV